MNFQSTHKNHFIALITLSLFNLYLRYFTWSISTIDWDETTYLIMGESMLRGFIPYKDYWDLKPMGIYYLNSIFISIWGYSLISIRISSYLFTTILVFSIYLLLKNFSKKLGLMAGMTLAVLFLIYPQGLSGNTEIYFLSFETLGVYFFFSKVRIREFLGAVLLGIAFLIKYIIIFDLIYFYILKLFIVYISDKNKKRTNHFYKSFGKLFLLGIFSLLPLFMTAFHFLFFYEWSYFLSSFLSVLQKHKNESSLIFRLEYLFIFLYKYLIIYLLVFIPTIFKNRWRRIFKTKLFFISFGWLISSSIGSIWTGFLYDHYFLAILPSLCILLFLFLNLFFRLLSKKLKEFITRYKSTSKWNQLLKLNSLNFIYILFFLSVVYTGIQTRNRLEKISSKIEDYPVIIADHISKNGGGNLFIASGYHATYVLLKQLPQVKYVQPNNYTETIFAKNFNINLEEYIDTLKNKTKFIQWCDRFSPSDIINSSSIDENKYYIPFYIMISDIILSVFIEEETNSKSCKLFKRKE